VSSRVIEQRIGGRADIQSIGTALGLPEEALGSSVGYLESPPLSSRGTGLGGSRLESVDACHAHRGAVLHRLLTGTPHNCPHLSAVAHYACRQLPVKRQ
jgi:hypothetical protein